VARAAGPPLLLLLVGDQGAPAGGLLQVVQEAQVALAASDLEGQAGEGHLVHAAAAAAVLLVLLIRSHV
jgi:hypothetical protein